MSDTQQAPENASIQTFLTELASAAPTPGGGGAAAISGAMGAALTFGSRRPGVLLALLILPLFVPMLILGVMAFEQALAQSPATPYVLLQTALVLAALPLAPLVAAQALKDAL